MRTFKPGDRAVYEFAEESVLVKIRCVVEIVEPHGVLHIEKDGTPGVLYAVPASWCRKLRTKKRREVWIREADLPGPNTTGKAFVSGTQVIGEPFVRFVEARGRK